MKQTEMNTSVLRVFLWSGVVLVAALIIAQGWLMGFLPGPSPSLSAKEIAQIFIERKDNILLGCLLQIITWCFYGTWAIPIIMFIRKMERSMPALTYASLVNVGGGWVFFILIPMTWAVIAFRAETLDPGIIQIMNDWVWFDWLYTWPSFSVWMFIIAAAIFFDHNVPTIYPRWVAFFNVWCGILIFPAGMIGFFKKGPFAYDGLLAFWFAVSVFFGWMLVMTVTTFRVISSEDKRLNEEAAKAAN
ncbi:hypothetical protein [Ferribacterium limneticum]|uniref:hypothetical protein n=1 Tax=Ferribacterium limneticum TaxID=76259 RepID=UPI001CF8F71E|nr:hypothetical protein [Ferribacterium limneticum]UCV23678.1 hypothetical protein KI613_03825 [Ferribacterium limneticum]